MGRGVVGPRGFKMRNTQNFVCLWALFTGEGRIDEVGERRFMSPYFIKAILNFSHSPQNLQ